MADAGLSEVVQRSPDEIPDDIGERFNRFPVLQGFPGCRLGTIYDAVGMAILSIPEILPPKT